jgi:hypothetical protein
LDIDSAIWQENELNKRIFEPILSNEFHKPTITSSPVKLMHGANAIPSITSNFRRRVTALMETREIKAKGEINLSDRGRSSVCRVRSPPNSNGAMRVRGRLAAGRRDRFLIVLGRRDRFRGRSENDHGGRRSGDREPDVRSTEILTRH